jgi:hypothetical protein
LLKVALNSKNQIKIRMWELIILLKIFGKNSFNIQNITSLTWKLTAKHFRFTQTYNTVTYVNKMIFPYTWFTYHENHMCKNHMIYIWLSYDSCMNLETYVNLNRQFSLCYIWVKNHDLSFWNWEANILNVKLTC